MAIQYSDAVRNAQNDAWESTIGTAPTLEIRSGAQPANCAAADSGTLLATITLPSDWMGASASGTKAKAGSWTVAASAAGTAGHYRIKQGATCHEQGSVGLGSGDLSLDNTSIAVGQNVTISTFSRTQGNA